MAQGYSTRAVPLILGLSLMAGSARGQDCAEGDWSCEPAAPPATAAPPSAPEAPETSSPDAEQAPPEAPAAPAETPPSAAQSPSEAPPPGAHPPEGGAPEEPDVPEPAEPPAVIYETRRSTWEEEDAPPPLIIVDPRTRPGEPPPEEIGVRERPEHVELRPRPRWEPLWGVAGRVQTALGRSRGRDVEMSGLGVGVRYRPVPHFALELGFDSLRGRDWHGDRRRESFVSASALVYFNPDATFQVYMPLGLHGSWARVERETTGSFEEHTYGYFGAHAGVGGEIRLSPRVALPLELLGFVRGRVDRASRQNPEFVDESTMLVTNTSGGGLLRFGVVVYW
jgi:hypothetical protein